MPPQKRSKGTLNDFWNKQTSSLKRRKVPKAESQEFVSDDDNDNEDNDDVVILDTSSGGVVDVAEEVKAHCPSCGQQFSSHSPEGRQRHADECPDDSSIMRTGVYDEDSGPMEELEPHMLPSTPPEQTGDEMPQIDMQDFDSIQPFFAEDLPEPRGTETMNDDELVDLVNEEEEYEDCSDIETAAQADDDGDEVVKENAFSAIMKGNKEVGEWKQAERSEKAKFRHSAPRKCPFYKIMSPFPFAVDAFRYGKIPDIKAYFLTHAHGDHYTNLSKSWEWGPIYCSETTANIIKLKLGVKEEWIRPLSMDTVHSIENVNVTLIDANHCPGSVLFVFEGYNANNRYLRYLHCGDFRASPAQLLHPRLCEKKVDICYLDTTYLNPRYTFPAQEQVIQECADMILSRIEGDTHAFQSGSVKKRKESQKQTNFLKGWLVSSAKKVTEATMAKADNDVNKNVGEEMKIDSQYAKASTDSGCGRYLVAVGTYSIGKERIVKGIAKALKTRIFCTDSKKKLFSCITDDPELTTMLTDDPLEGQVHVLNLFQITGDALGDYLDRYKGSYDKIIGLRPTGWSFRSSGGTLSDGQLARLPVEKFISDIISSDRLSTKVLFPQRDATERCQTLSVCYSEHSSFSELTCFCVSLDVSRIIATVNVNNATSRAKMNVWFERWAAERKRRKELGEPWLVQPRSDTYW